MSHPAPVALIAGDSGIIGRSVALHLAQAGFDVAIASTDPDDIQVVTLEIQALGRRNLGMLIDVNREEQVLNLVRRAQAELGEIDLLVNNASANGASMPMHEIERAQWDQVLSVNLTGAFLCAKAVLPGMIARQRGKIVNIAPFADHAASGFCGPYAVSRWGLIGLTQSLAREVGNFNVQVNAICPGPIDKEDGEGETANGTTVNGAAPAAEESTPAEPRLPGRFVRSDDVAHAVVFLASPAGDRITGQTLDITASFGHAPAYARR